MNYLISSTVTFWVFLFADLIYHLMTIRKYSIILIKFSWCLTKLLSRIEKRALLRNLILQHSRMLYIWLLMRYCTVLMSLFRKVHFLCLKVKNLQLKQIFLSNMALFSNLRNGIFLFIAITNYLRLFKLIEFSNLTLKDLNCRSKRKNKVSSWKSSDLKINWL